MIFVLISECERTAHCKTRAVLDAYAERAGQYTWIANLSQAGIDSLFKKLKSTASKNTAVACHKIGRNYFELLWIVGSKSKFNEDMVPINYTELDDPTLISSEE